MFKFNIFPTISVCLDSSSKNYMIFFIQTDVKQFVSVVQNLLPNRSLIMFFGCIWIWNESIMKEIIDIEKISRFVNYA